MLLFRGDTITFFLSVPEHHTGTAWIRTNIGRAAITRREIIRKARQDIPLLGRDWFDIPMQRVSESKFKITIGLTDVGHFEAKCFFLTHDPATPLWPAGENTIINVEPADTCCANIIYNAFVRQFGPNKNGTFAATHLAADADTLAYLDNSGYTVIPPSGTFRDLIGELDGIIGKLGCRIIHLLPVHPTPTTYARMGRFGSPYAALSFTAVDPAQAVFDPYATPLEQFLELVDAIHKRNAKIIMDIAINHTGWAADLHETHPHWLARDEEGRIIVPGAWGVEWSDLTKLDYSHKDVWTYMANVFLTWCRRGIDGFRCDAGYMIPTAAWQYIVATIREQFPDTIFFLEGLGGKISVTRDILNKANFNWAYSELFQNYTREQIEHYLPEALDISQTDGITIHFAETHDNNRLAAISTRYAKMRTALCALTSLEGGFGFANGVEWFATEKINVHDAKSLNWGAEKNQIDHIQRLTQLLTHHPAFFDQTRLSLIQHGHGNFIAMLRHHVPTSKRLIILINLNIEHTTQASWRMDDPQPPDPEFIDLLTGTHLTIHCKQGLYHLQLDPGKVYCLTQDPHDLSYLTPQSNFNFTLPPRIHQQRLRVIVLEILRFYYGISDIGDMDIDAATAEFQLNPIEFCRRINPESGESRVITWQWPRDIKRNVMIPPNHFLLIQAPTSFQARIIRAIIGQEEETDRILASEKSFQLADGTYAVLFIPLPAASRHRSRILRLTLHTEEKSAHQDAPLLFLGNAGSIEIQHTFSRKTISEKSLLFLDTNSRGGMLRAHIPWAALESKYDALLAANLHQGYPENRHIMLTRLRAWIVYQGYSQEISFDVLDHFSYDHDTGACWHYIIPTGQGEHIHFSIHMFMVKNENAIQAVFYRHPQETSEAILDDHERVRLIVRPDIEDRNFHETTKAYTGPEQHWPNAIQHRENGFSFQPYSNRTLTVHVSSGSFIIEPEWHYMVYRSIDDQRGMDPHSDVFSPGYFISFLNGDQSVILTANVNDLSDGDQRSPSSSSVHTQPCFRGDRQSSISSIQYLTKMLDSYIVKRNDLKTVIAGYPWFLDWGRDSLIFTRGMIAAGKLSDAKMILKQFGQFQENGTLPNMIQGTDAGNRDTSDAPLWFFSACADLVAAEETDAFLEEKYANSTIRNILIAMAHAMIRKTPNGIYVDDHSGLIYSPSHFTWMDTNYPAGTPREGYCIEIQALWYAALSFLARIDPAPHGEVKNSWQARADQVKSSIKQLFWLDRQGYLADCLHTHNMPAQKEDGDDALRPNQLLAITLGAIDDTGMCRKILNACEELLVPGAIRSLADRPLERPLEIRLNNAVINNPYHPYQGTYLGDEDSKRKPAYHNGTAWTWMFPLFCEAWAKVYGDKAVKTALAWLNSSSNLINNGCIGHVPEIVDGDFPHTPRGCDAQAWGISEWIRVWKKLTG